MKLYTNLTPYLVNKDVLQGLLVEKPYVLRDILECKRLVKNNSKVLAELLKKNIHAAEWILGCYVEDNKLSDLRRKLYIPATLSIEDKDAILCEYIDRPNANINYPLKVDMKLYTNLTP